MTFIVEPRGAKLGKAGDNIRQGRVDRGASQALPRKLELTYDQRADGCIYVLSAVVEVGIICRQPQGSPRPGFNYLCFLPGQSSKPKYAADIDKAKDAMRSAVETFVEAAGWQPRAKHRHGNGGNVTGWRAGD